MPYVYNKRVVCNKDIGHAGTSQYIGLDVGSGRTTKKITTRYIFEKGSNSGTVAMIFTPLGNTSAAQILERSVHVITRSTYIRLQLCDNYNVTNYPVHYFNTPLPLDGVTENEASVEVSGNQVILKAAGETFIETITGVNLSDYFGRYADFEFYCDGNRDTIAMPEFTYVKLENDLGGVLVEDHFDRPDGLLTIAPNGVPYSLFT